VKKQLVAGLFALAAPALLVSPAGAAVPTKNAKQTMACPEGSGTARLWATTHKGTLTKLAVDNPCSWYLGFTSGDNTMLVAPGTHFNWGKKRIAAAQKAGLPLVPGGQPNWADVLVCDRGTVTLISRYDDAVIAC